MFAFPNLAAKTSQFGGLAIGIVLVACACIGATAEPPGRQEREVSARLQAAHATPLMASWKTAILSAGHPELVFVRTLPKNLQLPRAPRHRSERPSSATADAEAVTLRSFLGLLRDDIHRAFIPDGYLAHPLSGHPSELLRPPSLTA